MSRSMGQMDEGVARGGAVVVHRSAGPGPVTILLARSTDRYWLAGAAMTAKGWASAVVECGSARTVGRRTRDIREAR